MHLSTQQQQTYEQKGFVLITNQFSTEEINKINNEIDNIINNDNSYKLFEEDGKTIRLLYGFHLNNEFFSNLSQDYRLVEPAKQMLKSEVYIHWFKINFKAAFNGDIWAWHQDYTYLNELDGLSTPQAINVILFLDDVDQFNAPLYLIPGSHQENNNNVIGEDDIEINNDTGTSFMATQDRYSTDKKTVAKLVSRYGIESATGVAGTILCIHPQCIHASPSNISPYNRKIMTITYNSVNNIPIPVEKQRSELIVGRNYTPIKSICTKQS
ncbi:MAG: phytanoyl-CoA dioxygenase family protein [Cyanobacteria bacterium P01_D01_bin.50]